MQVGALHAPTCIRIPSYSSRTAPIHQYTSKQNNTPTYSCRLLRMNVITFETCWAIKNFHKVTSSWFNLFNWITEWEDNSMCQYSSSQCDNNLSQHGNTTGLASYIIMWGFCGFLECRQLLPHLCNWKHKTISTSSLTATFLFSGQTTLLWKQGPC